MGKKETYRKKYNNYSTIQLKAEKTELEHTIKSCEEYIRTAYNTFLGPLSAVSTIKDSYKRIEVINDVLREKENAKSELKD